MISRLTIKTTQKRGSFNYQLKTTHLILNRSEMKNFKQSLPWLSIKYRHNSREGVKVFPLSCLHLNLGEPKIPYYYGQLNWTWAFLGKYMGAEFLKEKISKSRCGGQG